MSDTTTIPDPNTVTGNAPGGGTTTSVGGVGTGVTLPTLPPQYSTGNLGFFTRQTESVTSAVTVGPDGALYVGVLTAIPYPQGYASVYRIADPTVTTGYNGVVPSGVPQTYASGFTEMQSIGFDKQGDLFVLEYLNANAVYDPTQSPASLPPGALIKVAPDGTRTTISGDELKLPNYLLVDPKTSDIFVAINNASQDNGEVLRYHTDAATGSTSYTVVASGLANPRGMSFGPDGNLYVLEAGDGTPSSSPDVASAPVIPFIPGLVSERGGYTGAITKVDLNGDAAPSRVLTGLASFREFNPTSNQDRVISIGANSLTIAPDGTAYIGSGGGLAPETAVALGSFSDTLKGILKVEGLFGADPSQATVTPEFDALSYAAANGPDGETTIFNTESNLYDTVIGTDGKLYTVDAARNLVYGLTNDGSTLDSVTILQKQPPVLTPPQYAAVIAAGGDPSAQYAAEITTPTVKNADGVPTVPGNIPAPPPAMGTPGDVTNVPSLPAGVVSTGSTSSDPSMGPPPHGEDTTGSGASGSNSPPGVPGGPPGGLPPSPFPGPTDPLGTPVLPGNKYSYAYDPFFGNYAPDPSNPLPVTDGQGGTYTVSKVYTFGDRLADNGNGAALVKSLGEPALGGGAPYSPFGNFTDGAKWTTTLTQILGVTADESNANFAYYNASARALFNPFDPNQSQAPLTNFAGQISAFEQSGQSFAANDLVTVTFGGNDISLPSDLSPTDGINASINAITVGLQKLADLGAKHFLVTNVPDITMAPLFKDLGFLAASGAGPNTYQPLVDQFNAKLASALIGFGATSGLDVKEADLHTLFKGIADDPKAYGFTNVGQPVLINPPAPGSTPIYNPAIVGQDPAVEHGSLFLDPFFDPTALGQAVIAQTVRNTLTA